MQFLPSDNVESIQPLIDPYQISPKTSSPRTSLAHLRTPGLWSKTG